ncbi:MAG: DsbA family protein [Acidimicrobiia bacterium]|nr:DsbA family protein [Acidimicrobiia bacterium]
MSNGAVTGGADLAQRIEVHIDPMCPYAYQTSLWLREVRAHTGLEIHWRFFSLELVNLEEGKTPPWAREWSYGWSQMRVATLLRRQGQEHVDRWYEAVGRAFFVDERPTFDPDEHRVLLGELGYEPALVDEALADPTTHDEVRADHDEVVGRHGGHGVPTIVFPDGMALFGPVVVPAPTGDDALALWELVNLWRRFPHLYEIRKPKTQEDLAHIGAAFAPYLRARKWRSVAKPAL